MTTLYLDWNGDFVLTPNGSMQTATGWDEIRQRIIRRLITNSAQQLPDGSTTQADYIFHPTYGLGLGAMIDQAPTGAFWADFQQRVNDSCLADVDIDPGFTPVITYSRPQPDMYVINIGVQLKTGKPGSLSVAIRNPQS